MKIAVYDTYVKKDNGDIMHFDILVPASLNDEKTVFAYGRSYLKHKGQDVENLSSKECNFCHIEEPSAEMLNDIHATGYSIIEMEGC